MPRLRQQLHYGNGIVSSNLRSNELQSGSLARPARGRAVIATIETVISLSAITSLLSRAGGDMGHAGHHHQAGFEFNGWRWRSASRSPGSPSTESTEREADRAASRDQSRAARPAPARFRPPAPTGGSHPKCLLIADIIGASSMDNIPRVIILGGERWASNVRTIASRSRACPLRHARTASNAVMRRSGPRHCARMSATRIRIRELRPQPLCLSIRAARYCSSLRLPCGTTRSESTNAAASAICRPGGSTCGSSIYLEAQRSN